MGPHSDTAAIVVTFHPDLTELRANLHATLQQVSRLWLIDNSFDSEARRAIAGMASDRVSVVSMPGNVGLAAALNAGLAEVKRAGMPFALALDQDSTPAADMVALLHRDLRLAEATSPGPVAAIGPTQLDLRTRARAPFVRFAFPMNRKAWPAAGAIVPCDFLISSGCLFRMAALTDIGDMDAGLFIDNVDMEWSHRAVCRGYRLVGSADAELGHRIGDRLRWRPFGNAAIHSPVRLYYMMRNRVLLYGRSATPRVWVLQDVPRALLKFAGFSLFVAPRRENARAMLTGLIDGLKGRTGPTPERPAR